MTPISQRIADELGARTPQVDAAVALLDGGATVPFIARYRKEATGGLDDAQLRTLEERLRYLRELEERRAAILASIQEQGKLDAALEAAIKEADTKARLEDLYLPFKPKRRTKAQIAKEAGLEPLADALLADPTRNPEETAAAYLDTERGVPDTTAALDGARQILTERFAEDADLVGALREHVWENAKLVSKVAEGKAEAGAKFADYFDYAEPIKAIPSHRALALFRGSREEVLWLSFDLGDGEDRTRLNACELRIAQRFDIADQGRAADKWLVETVRWAWRVRIALHIETDLRLRLWQIAEEEGINVFAANLRDLLLAAPAGARSTMGLDPGFRTGVKVAVVDGTGKIVATETIYPHEPRKRWDESIATLAELARRHAVALIAIGNGTASRETDKLAAELIRRHPELTLTKAMVSEAGASVYSASAYASQELPELDVSLRGAVSIARRLQDPLAELVKIDPKSIGVGQYQHDVSEVKLSRSLDAVVEDCVNAVGVDANTASARLLARVSGLGEALAQAVVAHRDRHGPFRTREALREVPRLGPKAFELAAGFLRIADGDDPLDASAVHPEAYPVVRRIAAATQGDIRALIGNAPVLRKLTPDDFTDATFGLPTVVDILRELEKPGRDPRPQFKTASFREGVETLEQLKPGMRLEGVVTNVANFGAFVDIGVHQDGLVHVSALADRFIKDPRTVVKPGDVVKVRVLEVDLKRRRISLSMRSDDSATRLATQPGVGKAERRSGIKASGTKASGAKALETKAAKRGPASRPPATGGALAEAFARARQARSEDGR
ncbi:Tex family protein [Rhodospirillaceae bacterium SYSU D60014]|uniref:Tex family protein n=1 Tax=Virgifigura deserti TaxID=2268457 RepID=UPI000E672A3A